jgi:two-component system, sensor histidine kinase PdtaS
MRLFAIRHGETAWTRERRFSGARDIPLTEHGQRVGAVLLCRDVSELRRRERELITKDATIREIHHRVKNNLQTVAALLRLQSRRMSSPEAREALGEAMRRVATIALVHETLSQTLDESVPFDDLVGRSLRLAADVATEGAHVRTTVRGSFGSIPAEDATALALILTELVTNAVEHGFEGRESGTVEVIVDRQDDVIRVEVADDGSGLPEGRAGAGSGLGTQIVSTLVTNEMRGTIEWSSREGGGTSVVIEARLRAPRDAASLL